MNLIPDPANPFDWITVGTAIGQQALSDYSDKLSKSHSRVSGRSKVFIPEGATNLSRRARDSTFRHRPLEGAKVDRANLWRYKTPLTWKPPSNVRIETIPKRKVVPGVPTVDVTNRIGAGSNFGGPANPRPNFGLYRPPSVPKHRAATATPAHRVRPAAPKNSPLGPRRPAVPASSGEKTKLAPVKNKFSPVNAGNASKVATVAKVASRANFVVGAGASAFDAYGDYKSGEKTKTEAVAKGVGAIGGGALGGMAAGAAVGSFAGPVGTAVGAGVGAFVGSKAGEYAAEKGLEYGKKGKDLAVSGAKSVGTGAKNLGRGAKNAVGGGAKKVGKWLGFKDGGEVLGPGSSIGDVIPAFLSSGEFVVNARSAQSNLPLLQAMNRDARALASLLPGHSQTVRPLAGTARATGRRVDRSTTINLSTPDIDTAFHKAKTFEAQRSLTYSGRWS
ncbi:hypothetical protein [Nocardia mangyaensis]|uniref:hypothetical protein n=1 Tax=Nocardia mangyaensis TaxID=2213200 RepID=UPI0012EBDDCA|nr:hypothetical protein [Nocardia mangyaensis]